MSMFRPDITEYPFAPHYFPINGQQLHYIDEGEGEVLLFVHGTPSWSFDFRNVIRSLSDSFRCIAIDHMGFGLSGKPGTYDYSTAAHSITLEAFIIANDLRGITLVVHDFGGPIGLDVAIRHPDRIARIVALNSWLWSAADDPAYRKMLPLLRSPLLPFLYRQLNFSPRFLLPRSFGSRKPSKKILRQYILPFAAKKERNGPLAFARSLLNDQDWFESLWQRKKPIASKPALFIWGMKDPVLPARYLQKFESGFADSRALMLPDCGHFPQEEAPSEVIAAIRTFMHDTRNTGE